MDEKNYDIVIVGSGTSAYYCGYTLAGAGKKVAIVDERPYGGTCALRGCQPKKYLVANADAIAMAQHLVGQGVESSPTTNWAQLQKLKNEFIDGLSEGSKSGYEKAGIDTYDGHAIMNSENSILVNDSLLLKARTIVIATGSKPRKSDIDGHEHMGNSETFLDLPELPQRVMFVGGGYISFEFATVSAYAGAQATILHRSDRPLKAFDQDIVSTLLKATKEAGINLITNESPTKIEKVGDHFIVHGKSGTTYEVDLVIEASGRVPNLSVLERDNHHVNYTKRGILVNEYYQSVSNPNVYAIGDVADIGYQLAPVADKEGEVAAKNIINGNTITLDYDVVPSVVFTIPNMASVGLSEEKAKALNIDYRVNIGTTVRWPSSKRIGEKHSAYKVLIEKGTDRILGAHMVRHNSSEAINLFALAIKHKMCSEDLLSMIWAYPTYISDIKYMVK